MSAIETERIDSNSSETDEEDEGMEISYAELYSNALLNGEVIIVIPIEDEERVKTGIKNFKSKQNKKSKDEGLPMDISVISFLSSPSKEFPGYLELSIAVVQRGTVHIKAMRIPQDRIPD